MKIYEELTKEKIEVTCDGLQEDSHLNLEWSYVISLPVWVPLSILTIIFALFVPKSLFINFAQAFINFVYGMFKTTEGKSRDITDYAQQITKAANECISTNKKMPTFSVARNNNRRQVNSCSEVTEDKRIPTTHQNVSNIHNVNDMIEVVEMSEYLNRDATIKLDEISSIIETSNDFSEAFKYLCTCLPGNRILARKSIRL